eukprot:303559_1
MDDKYFNTENDQKIDDDDMMEKEISKPYQHMQKTNLAALYITGKHGWCLGSTLTPIGEHQEPVVNLIAPIIGMNFELCIDYIRQLQIRTDGTRRNINIGKHIYNNLVQQCNGLYTG